MYDGRASWSAHRRVGQSMDEQMMDGEQTDAQKGRQASQALMDVRTDGDMLAMNG